MKDLFGVDVAGPLTTTRSQDGPGPARWMSSAISLLDIRLWAIVNEEDGVEFGR